jgi:hypothetical protein
VKPQVQFRSCSHETMPDFAFSFGDSKEPIDILVHPAD